MRFLFLLLFLVTFSQASWWPFDESCEFTRDDALKCMISKVDLNHDGKITIEEIDQAKKKMLSGKIGTILRGFLWTFRITNEKILHDCDYNGDGVFTPEDFRLSTRSCLPKKWHLCQLKKIC